MSDVFARPPDSERAAAPGFWQSIRHVRINALRIWPDEAFDAETLVQTDWGRTRVLLNGEDAIHRVLIGNPRNYRRTPASVRVLRPITGEGLLLSEGETWRRQRQTVAPALAPRTMPLLARHVVREAARALDAVDGEAIDGLAWSQALTLEIAARSMFSVEIDAHGEQLRRQLQAFGADLGRPSMLDLMMPAHIPNLRDVRRALFRRRWLRLMDRIMAGRVRAGGRQHTSAGETPRDLFDLLLAARDPETGQGFTAAQLRDQMATMILAGHETTALTLFWSLYLLAAAPDVQERVAAEVAGIDPAAEAERNPLKSLPVTRSVVQEALRLYPPAFTLARQAIGPDTVGGTALSAGTIVMIAPWVLHRHRRLWADPERFDPTRFEGEPTLAHRFAYLPFGAGPRVCVGAQFALTEAVLILAMLVQRFCVSRPESAPIQPVAIITTQPERDATFRLEPRGGGATAARTAPGREPPRSR